MSSKKMVNALNYNFFLGQNQGLWQEIWERILKWEAAEVAEVKNITVTSIGLRVLALIGTK